MATAAEEFWALQLAGWTPGRGEDTVLVLSPKAWEGGLMVLVLVQVWGPKAEEDWCPSLKAGREREREEERETENSDLAFYSIQAFNALDVAHPYWRGQSALYSILI